MSERLEPQANTGITPFVVLAFTREDLLAWDISPEQIALLSDTDLSVIAEEMTRIYLEAGFQEMLELSIKLALTFKQ